MTRLYGIAALAAGVLAFSPSAVSAQSAPADAGWWDWAAPAVIGGARDARAVQGREVRNGNGPPFCRSGAGHPVHGRRWCAEKGWGGGLIRWERASLGDVVLRMPRGGRDRSVMRQGTLIDILGDVVFGRLAADARGGEVVGRWIERDGRSILQIRSGSSPLAELTDMNGDGRADVVLMPARR